MRIVRGVAGTALLLLTCSTAAAQTHPGAAVIPPSRLVDWLPGVTVGVPGGIPAGRTKCSTAECQALENAASGYRDGSTNATPLIQAAVTSAPPETFVHIPAGTWRLDAAINIGPADSRVTVRGSGESTVLVPRGSGQAGTFFVGSSSDYQWAHPAAGNVVLAGLTKGSTQVSIADTSAFTVGALAQLRFQNENTIERPIISVAGYPYLRRQFVRIVGKTASTLSFYPALYNSYSGDAAIAVAQQQVDFAGIEDLRIEAVNSAATFVIFFEQTFGAWVKNVHVRQGRNYNVFFNDSLQCEMRGSYLDELNHGGTNGAGLLMNTVTGCLIEDNIIRDAFPGIEVNNGSSGNVFAYNFINNTNGLMGVDTNHGPHNDFNLYEGNIAHNLMSDGYFGSNSDDTLFRNWLTGVAISSHPAPANPANNVQTWCISLKRFTRNYSIVGNVLGSGAPYVASSECDSYGQPNIGNGSSSGEAQPSAHKYWADWSPTTGTSILGTMTARNTVNGCANCGGTLNLTSGHLNVGQTPMLKIGGTSIWTVVKAVNGNTVTIDSSPWAVAVPAVGSSLEIWPGAAGYQELDLDVRATTVKKGNYSFFTRSIPASESLGGTQLPPSLFRRAKPSFFGNRSWPAFDPTNPNQTYDAGSPYRNYEVVPAAYRYFRGENPPGIDAATAPTIEEQPRDMVVSVGSSATFIVLASGVPNPTYQWKKNGSPIPGATLPFYSTPIVTAADSGTRFSCVVTNASGQTASREAQLVVGQSVAPTAPLNLRVQP